MFIIPQKWFLVPTSQTSQDQKNTKKQQEKIKQYQETTKEYQESIKKANEIIDQINNQAVADEAAYYIQRSSSQPTTRPSQPTYEQRKIPVSRTSGTHPYLEGNKSYQEMRFGD